MLRFGITVGNPVGVLSDSLELFDDTTFLGEIDDQVGVLGGSGLAYFRSPTSLFTGPATIPVATIDFSSILDGSIMGVFEYRIDSGIVNDATDLSDIHIALLRGTGYTPYSLDGLACSTSALSPCITNITAQVVPGSTAVPDPASTMLLLGMGLAGLACWRRR